MQTPVKLAVMGAGLIGKRHVEHILAEPEAALFAIVELSEAGQDFALAQNTLWFPDFTSMLAAGKPEAVIVATPNQLHMQNGLDCVTVGIPALIEKPLCDNLADAETLVLAAEQAGVPLLTGHHRRHNPMIQKAKAIIDSDRIGRVTAIHGFCWFYKPDDYFDVSWRREKGAGPVYLNLIHDVDLLRYLCGEIISVQAMESKNTRENVVEDTAVVLLRFANGALATVTVSDTIVAPWSWELTSGENPVYHRQEQPCYFIGGTHGSISLPQLDVFTNPDKRSWWEPLTINRESFTAEDPLRLQIRQLCRVVRGTETPLVSGRDGLETLRVISAVKEAAETGKMISF